MLGGLLGKNETSSIPAAKIKFGGKEWKSEDTVISSVSTKATVGPAASTCIICLTGNSSFSGSSFKMPSFADVKLGVKAEVELGYNIGGTNKTNCVFTGYVISVSINISDSHLTTCEVVCMDAKVSMMPNKRFEEKKGKETIPDVVKDILNKYSSKFNGNSVNIEGASEKLLDPVFQDGESDFELSCDIAKKYGCWFFVDNKGKVYFVSISAYKGDKISINSDDMVLSISSEIDLYGIPKDVEVKLPDLKDPEKALSSKVTSVSSVGSGKTPSSLSSSVDGSIVIVDHYLPSASTGKTIAEAVLMSASMNLFKVEIEIQGNSAYNLPAKLSVSGYANSINCDSLNVMEIRHHCDFSKNSYRTIVIGRGNKAEPPK